MASAKIQIGTLSGVPVLGAAEQSWNLVAGVKPFIGVFDIPIAGVKPLFDLGGPAVPHTLDMNGQQFKKIYIINQRPGDSPFMAKIVLADRRIWWDYILVTKRYNMRRRVGSRRRGDWQEQLQQDVVPAVQYASYSINPETSEPWKAQAMLKDVFTNPDSGLRVPVGDYLFDSTAKSLDEVPVDKLQLNDPGGKAVGRALASLPGAQVTVDPSGKVRVYSTVTGGEKAIVGDGSIGGSGLLGPEIVGGGHVEFVSNELMMPRGFDIFYQMETELRFDAVLEVAPGQTVEEADVPLVADNVAPIPDFDLLIAGQREFFGTYKPITQLLDAWTDNLPDGALITKLTPELINKAFIPGVGFFAALDMIGKLDSENTRALWSARFASLQQHYRQTFRINSDWRDRIFELKDYLVATIDLVSGQRAPAMAFTDHSYMPSRKGLVKAARAGQDLFWIKNVDSYPGEKVDFGDSSKPPAPARVTIVDSDQGIIRLEFQVDPFGFRDKVLPAKVKTEQNAPKNSWRRSDESRPPATNGVSFKGFRVAELDADQKTAMLVSGVPAAPNSKAQYYKISIGPKELEGMIPEALLEQFKKARGPRREIFVGPGIETARIRWQESARDLIKRIYGVGGTLDDLPPTQGPGGENLANEETDTFREQLAEHCVNDRPAINIEPQLQAASLQNIGAATAAAVLTQQRGRVKGAMTGIFKNLGLAGALQEIRYYIDGSGAALCNANLPEDVDPFNFFAFMDASTRAIIMKLPIGQQ